MKMSQLVDDRAGHLSVIRVRRKYVDCTLLLVDAQRQRTERRFVPAAVPAHAVPCRLLDHADAGSAPPCQRDDADKLRRHVSFSKRSSSRWNISRTCRHALSPGTTATRQTRGRFSYTERSEEHTSELQSPTNL